MAFLYRRDQIILFIGDLLVYTGALWLALFVRHFTAPSVADFWMHLAPFSFLFACWLLVFVTVGLYDRHVALFEHRLTTTITEAQIVNMVLAALFFFFAPVAIQPKTILALYFVISTLLIVVWRLGLFTLRSNKRGCEPSLMVGTGPDMAELVAEVRATPRTNLACAEFLDSATVPPEILGTQIADMMQRYKLATLVVDSRLLPQIEHLTDNPALDVIDASDLYEALFSRVPLSMLDRTRFMERALSRESRLYDILKRVMDTLIALVLGVVSLAVYPFVALAIWAEDRGGIFVSQVRVGKGEQEFAMGKFRTMTGNDNGMYGAEGKTKLRVTRVGNILRKSRIDELPQLWSVLKGEQSLVGPRPELPALVAEYTAAIPHYSLRHLVKPGLSGWAQIYHQAHPHMETAVTATAEKLSYDLYYIKHRSLILDFDIALKTMKALALRLGA